MLYNTSSKQSFFNSKQKQRNYLCFSNLQLTLSDVFLLSKHYETKKIKKFLLSFSFFISIAYKYFTDHFGKNNNFGYVLKHLFPHARSLIFLYLCTVFDY